MKLIRGNKYGWKHLPDTPDLMYIGACDQWNAFTKYEEGRFGEVWCEVLTSELHMLEKRE